MPRANAGTPTSFTYCAAGLHKPGRTYCRHCWPPRGRGKGENKNSPRRQAAWDRAWQAYELYRGEYRGDDWSIGGPRYYGKGYTEIARQLGYKDASGAWRAIHRLIALMTQQDLIESHQFPDMQAAYQAIQGKAKAG